MVVDISHPNHSVCVFVCVRVQCSGQQPVGPLLSDAVPLPPCALRIVAMRVHMVYACVESTRRALCRLSHEVDRYFQGRIAAAFFTQGCSSDAHVIGGHELLQFRL